jgi:hypothetical protein
MTAQGIMSVPLNLNTLIARAIAAYRLGRALPPAMSQGPSGELFRARAQALIEDRLDAHEHACYVNVRDETRRAVGRIESGDLSGARIHFSAIGARLEHLPAGEECQLLCRSWVDQGKAYLHARAQEWEPARRCLASAMASDYALESRFGYTLFHIGRVHVLHLMLRVDAGAGDVEKAIDTAQAIVEYLHGEREELPMGGGWCRGKAAAVPEDLRNAMTARIASEVGTQLALCGAGTAPALLHRFPAWRQLRDHHMLHEIYQWGETKEAFLERDSAGFLERALPMLAVGRRETTLWYAVVLDLCRACTALRPRAGGAFLDEVARDAEQWRSLPAALLPGLLCRRLRHNREDVERYAYIHRPPTRRFHLINVGLPRCGTSSIYSLFARFRAGNEFMERETITQCVRRSRGELSDRQFMEYIRRRDREGGLEVDSASFNHLYLDILRDEHPRARFLFLVRDPYTWTGSYIRMLRHWLRRFAERGRMPPQWMTDYGSMLLGDFSWDVLSWKRTPGDQLHSLAEAFVLHWATANRRVLDLLPEERSLVVRTDELSRRAPEIARFCGIPPDALTSQDHTNASEDRFDPLAGLTPGFFDALCARHAADVLSRTEFDAPASHAIG